MLSSSHEKKLFMKGILFMRREKKVKKISFFGSLNTWRLHFIYDLSWRQVLMASWHWCNSSVLRSHRGKVQKMTKELVKTRSFNVHFETTFWKSLMRVGSSHLKIYEKTKKKTRHK